MIKVYVNGAEIKAGFDPGQPRDEDGQWTETGSTDFSKKDDAETGQELNIQYLKNKEKAPYLGSRFGQDVEPTGMYVTQLEGFVPAGNYETGFLSLKNPLVISVTDETLVKWKYDLAQKYGKTGKKLTSQLIKLGHDGIVTKSRMIQGGKDYKYLGEIIIFEPEKSIVKK